MAWTRSRSRSTRAWTSTSRSTTTLRSCGASVSCASSAAHCSWPVGKDFLGAVLAGSWEGRVAAAEREWATAAATTLAVAEGAEMVRLHDRSALDALRTAAAICDRRAKTARSSAVANG